MDEKELDELYGQWREFWADQNHPLFGVPHYDTRSGKFSFYADENHHTPVSNWEAVKTRKQSQWDRMEFKIMTDVSMHQQRFHEDGITLQAFLKKDLIGEASIKTSELDLYYRAIKLTGQPVKNFADKKNILDFIKWLYYFRQYTEPVE